VPLRGIAQNASPVAPFPRERLGDGEIVAAVARGETAALGVAWDRYSHVVRAVIRSNLGVDAAVEDLLQEVFIALLKSAAELRDPSALRPYLVGVASRLVLVELRRRKVRRWVTLTPEGTLPDLPAPPRDLDGELALRALGRLLDSLPARRRVAFVLRQVHGLEVAEVAAALEVSESTAKREVARARRFVIARARRAEPALWDYVQRIEGDGDG